MTQEEKELLLLLLKKADSDSLLYIYDNNENTFEVTWVYLDNLDNKICIKINNYGLCNIRNRQEAERERV